MGNLVIFQPWSTQQDRVANIQYIILNDNKGDYVSNSMDANFKVFNQSYELGCDLIYHSKFLKNKFKNH